MSTKQPISDKQLEWWAQYLEAQAAKYREMAKTMREHKIEHVELTGWATQTQRVTKLLSGHTSRGRATVDKAVDAIGAGQLLVESGEKAVKQTRKKRPKE